MDLDEGADVLMHDEDILDSTEHRFTQSTDTSLGNSFEPSNSSGVSAVNKGRSETHKGDHVKQDVDLLDVKLNPQEDVPRPAKFEHLPYATAQTGLVYDVRMRFHVEMYPTEDDVHPEDPRRIFHIYQTLVNAGLVWQSGVKGPSDYYMGRINAREVTKDEVCLVHTERHWDWIQSLKDKTGPELLDELQHPDEYACMDSVYLSPNTPLCAALSAGGAIELCRSIILNRVKNGFAVIRPPGHHAEREDVKGFCFYDNVSIAAKSCQQEFGEKCRKILVLDWDVHHGNGIQQANYDDPNVLYISLHVHKDGKFYPEGSYRDKRPPYGDHLHVGEGAGMGYNVNIPWKTHGMGDADYIYAFQNVVMPIAMQFDPDLVIIAAGFDAADGDMLGGCHVTPAGYSHMTHMLMSLAQGRVAVCLEGGYNLESISNSALAVARTLMGEPPERLDDLAPTKTAVDDVEKVKRTMSKWWSALHPKDPSERLHAKDDLEGERMHNVVRKWQATTLWEDYQMSPLPMFHDVLHKTFENQVLATANYDEVRPLLVILHDPPEMLASPDPRTGRIELHNTWVTDIVKTYVDWAVKNKFAVIDVNLPKDVSADDSDDTDDNKYQETDSIEFRTREATQVLTYLWDNYIEPVDRSHIFLMGTNIGHGAIINWIKANESRAMEMVDKAISFVEDVPLQGVKSVTGNEQLQMWYYSSSHVCVSNGHNFWSTGYGSTKPKKRFGQIKQSDKESVSEMLVSHRDEVTKILLNETEDWRNERDPTPDEGFEEEETFITQPELTRLPPTQNFAPQITRSPTKILSRSAPGMGSSAPTPTDEFGSSRAVTPRGPPISSFVSAQRQGRLD
ncbi:Arginase/deacetylase [Teratosphaeria nubilosa]|uniref:Histone deacetylase n=1 Tax=Teratosphaeria nubilosa TaxID=161662 RepID=A0A6G1LH09_9PEZI|nr:Arginase/deacetylase [Teratosphaeria nubilosa]